MYVVIALSPAVDVSTVVGPFRSQDKALETSTDLELLGYNTEVCPCTRLEEVEASPPWDRTESVFGTSPPEEEPEITVPRDSHGMVPHYGR